MTVVLLYTGIADLVVVKKFLKSVVAWKKLGLELGLLYPTLQKIEKEQHEKVDDCLMEMLSAWLQQQDNVSQNGVPSWSVLRTALEEIGERQLASEIIIHGEHRLYFIFCKSIATRERNSVHEATERLRQLKIKNLV